MIRPGLKFMHQAGTSNTQDHRQELGLAWPRTKIHLVTLPWHWTMMQQRLSEEAEVFIPRAPGDTTETNERGITGHRWQWWHWLTQRNRQCWADRPQGTMWLFIQKESEYALFTAFAICLQSSLMKYLIHFNSKYHCLYTVHKGLLHAHCFNCCN